MLDKQLKDISITENWSSTNNRTIEKQKLTNHERKMNEHFPKKEN